MHKCARGNGRSSLRGGPLPAGKELHYIIRAPRLEVGPCFAAARSLPVRSSISPALDSWLTTRPWFVDCNHQHLLHVIE